jgi:rubrerythrin
MELESMRFYQAVAKRAANQSMRKPLDELAVAEQVRKENVVAKF